MADSRRFPPADGRNDVRAAVADVLALAFAQRASVAVALSGGRDSVALLDATVNVAAGTHLRAVAFHIHHGLSPNADRWSRFCRELCAALNVPFATREVQVATGARTGVEAAARNSRYAALAALAHAHGVDAVLRGHHADEQAETVLLQLLRGAGPRGLAAMPAAAAERGVRWLRPFLDLPRHVLDGYVARHRLAFIDDESNADTRYRRNALRASVVPALRILAPGYPQTLVRAARHQSEAAALLDELAELDARVACDGATLECAALAALAAPRARNLLRWFLHRNGLRAPSSARLCEMLAQLTRAGADARVAIAHDGAELGIHRGRAIVHRPAPQPYRRHWTGATSVALPHGTLLFNATRGEGIASRRLASSPVTICNGTPGERLHVGTGAMHRPVADLLREAGVPHWDRASLPRLYCGDALAALPYAGVDAAFAACGDEPAFALDWRPDCSDDGIARRDPAARPRRS
jgi:tRNA(Ile)-lysidine synthase